MTIQMRLAVTGPPSKMLVTFEASPSVAGVIPCAISPDTLGVYHTVGGILHGEVSSRPCRRATASPA